MTVRVWRHRRESCLHPAQLSLDLGGLVCALLALLFDGCSLRVKRLQLRLERRRVRLGLDDGLVGRLGGFLELNCGNVAKVGVRRLGRDREKMIFVGRLEPCLRPPNLID